MSSDPAFKDHGLFLCFAQRVARDTGNVFYHNPSWENGAPTPDKDHIGYGVPGITVADTWDDCIEEEKPDLLVYPDVGFGGEQERERKLGSTVFGTGRGEILEDDRIFFRKILEKKKLPYAPYDVAHTVEELREKLKKVKDKWVKLSMYRGVGETFHHENYDKSLSDIVHWELGIGVFDKEKQIDIIIEDPIKAFLKNIALEWFVTDEGYLDMGLMGLENKNSGYLGRRISYNEVHPSIRKVADAFLPVFKKYRVRGAISLEGHQTENGDFYYDDPCMRFGSPPGEGICEAYDDIYNLIKRIAEGKLAKPKMPHKYIAEVMLQLREPCQGQVPLDFPENKFENIKIRNLCKLDGQYYHIAQDKEPIIGAAVGRGNSIQEAKDEALAMAAKVKGSGVYFDKDCFEAIDEDIKKAKKVGINF